MHLKKIFAVTALAAMLAVPMVSFGATFKGGEQFNLRTNETVEGNFYAAGGSVTLAGTINGDVLTVGGNVILTGTVRDDMMIAGGDVDLGGTVNGDVRIVGGNVTIRGTVNGEVTIAGGSVVFLSTAKSAKDVMIVGGDVTMGGEVLGMLTVRAGKALVDGHVAGEARVYAGEKVTLGAGAVIDGAFFYKAPSEVTLNQGSQVKGKTTYEKSEARADKEGARQGFMALLGIWFLVKLVSLIITGILLIHFAGHHIQKIVDHTFAGFGKEVLRGSIILVMVPLAVIFLCITLIGIVPGVVLGIFYVLMLVLAKVMTGILVGSALERLFNKNKEVIEPVTWKTVISGTVVLAVVGFIPVIGWIAAAVFGMAALGSTTLFIYMKLRTNA